SVYGAGRIDVQGGNGAVVQAKEDITVLQTAADIQIAAALSVAGERTAVCPGVSKIVSYLITNNPKPHPVAVPRTRIAGDVVKSPVSGPADLNIHRCSCKIVRDRRDVGP